MTLVHQVYHYCNWKHKFLEPPPKDATITGSWWEGNAVLALRRLSNLKEETKSVVRSLYLYHINGATKLAIVEEKKSKKEQESW